MYVSSICTLYSFVLYYIFNKSLSGLDRFKYALTLCSWLIFINFNISYRSFEYDLICWVVSVLSNSTNCFHISFILTFTGPFAWLFKYSMYLVSFDLSKMYIRSCFLTPVDKISRNWANFFKVANDKRFNLLISFKSSCEIDPFYFKFLGDQKFYIILIFLVI